jgi:hypothetical protein
MMTHRRDACRRVLLSLACLAAAAPASVLGTGAHEENAVLNPGFELYASTDGTGGPWDGALYWWESWGSSSLFFNFPPVAIEDADGDGDLEAVFGGGNGRDLRQDFAAGSSLSANFRSLEFTREAGDLSGGWVTVALTLAPTAVQGAWPETNGGAWLSFFPEVAPEAWQPNAEGRVSLDPALHGYVLCAHPGCEPWKADFDAADPDRRRAILGEARLLWIRISDYRFDNADPLVLDDVALLGATTAADEIAAGHVRVNPCLEPCLPSVGPFPGPG